MISATASDNSGVVSRVEFYIDTTPLYTTNVSPYSYSWNTNSVADGSYTLYAKAYDTAGNFGQSSISVTVSNIAITVPGIPTNVSATAGKAQATVSFSAPASNGGSAITSYTATSSAGQTATGTASPITVTGLTNGTAYTFNVTATNSAGTGPPSAASNSVTPSTSPVRAVSFSSISPASPRTVGTSVTFISSASGGSRSYQYQFLVKRAVVRGTWTTARVYSLSPSFTWSTSGLSKGTYYIQVQARNIGSTASYEAAKTITYRLK